MSTPVPFFTVALTTYNRADLLAEAVQSVMAQDFDDYELLIIDDASPDNTAEVATQLIQTYAQQPGRPTIRFHRQPENRRVDEARNEAIRHARGRFIAYLDDDDRFAPGFLRQAHAALRDAPATVGFALTGRRIYRRTAQGDTLLQEVNHGYTVATCLSGDQYLENTRGGASGLIVRPDAVVAAGGWPSGFRSGGDADLMVRMAAQGDCMVIPDAILIVYNLERSQITKSLAERGKARERLVERNAAIFSRFPSARISHYREGARNYYAAQQRQDGRRCMQKALKIQPFAPKMWLLLLLFEMSDFLPRVMRQRLFLHTYRGV